MQIKSGRPNWVPAKTLVWKVQRATNFATPLLLFGPQGLLDSFIKVHKGKHRPVLTRSLDPCEYWLRRRQLRWVSTDEDDTYQVKSSRTRKYKRAASILFWQLRPQWHVLIDHPSIGCLDPSTKWGMGSPTSVPWLREASKGNIRNAVTDRSESITIHGHAMHTHPLKASFDKISIKNTSFGHKDCVPSDAGAMANQQLVTTKRVLYLD